MYDFYLAMGQSELAVVCSYVAIVPQNTQSFTATINGEKLETTPEHRQSAADWVIITKQQIVDHFDMAKLNGTEPFKPEWIARQKATLQQVKKQA
jgi:hypothetical protein